MIDATTVAATPTRPQPALDGHGGLTVVTRHCAAGTVVSVCGELDGATAPRFLAAFDDLSATTALRGAAAGTVPCDLSALRFVSAAGVTALEAAHRLCRQRDVDLRFVSCSRPVRRVLSLVGSPLAPDPPGFGRAGHADPGRGWCPGP